MKLPWLFFESFNEFIDRQSCSRDEASQRASRYCRMIWDGQCCDMPCFGENDMTAALSGGFPAELLERFHHVTRPQDRDWRH